MEDTNNAYFLLLLLKKRLYKQYVNNCIVESIPYRNVIYLTKTHKRRDCEQSLNSVKKLYQMINGIHRNK